MNKSIVNTLVLAGLLIASDQTLAGDISAKQSENTLNKTIKIIGGKEATPAAYPFMTALTSGTREDISPFCGASFVGGRYVLTAAHCIEGR